MTPGRPVNPAPPVTGTLRVIHIISGLGQGGAEAMLEKLILTGRRVTPEIEQRVINLSTPGVVGARLAAAGVPVESLQLAARPRLVRQLLVLRSRLAAAAPVTVVQTWLWHADLLGGMCARAAGNRRVVWNLRNSMPSHAATKPASRAVARLCAWLSGRVPARIICNSHAALAAHAAIGYRTARCVLIPNGFDLERFRPCPAARERVRAQWGASASDILVGMVARVDPLKDHAGFIAAASALAAQQPRARFVLIGTGVTHDPGIRAHLARNALAARFILEERREDVQAVMCALDVFCLASRSEGFPNVLGEAMACATPVVSTDVGDAREIIGDERLIAPVGDPRALAACLRELLVADDAARRELGVRQRERIAAHFDIERVWQQYVALYRAL